MTADVRMAEVAALVGDQARANILSALMGGRALTASELVHAAGVSPQTTSGHLGKLANGRLIACVKQGRHRYYRIATPRVAEMLEGPWRSSPMRRRATGRPRSSTTPCAWRAPATIILPASSASD